MMKHYSLNERLMRCADDTRLALCYKEIMRRFVSIRQITSAMFIGLGLSYFGLQLMKGDRGVYAYLRESHRKTQLEQDLAEVTAKREATELRVAGLRSDSLDLDLLDEQARRMLGMMAPEEKVILLDSVKR